MPETYYPPNHYPIGFYPPGFYPTGIGDSPSNLRLIFDDIVARLVATNAFAIVEHGGPSEELIAAADDYPCVAIEEKDWKEDDTYDSSTSLCKSSFDVTIACKDVDPVHAKNECRRLAAIASNAISGKILAGKSWGTQTYLDRGKFDRQRHPESRIILSGSFVYEVRTSTARSEL